MPSESQLFFMPSTLIQSRVVLIVAAVTCGLCRSGFAEKAHENLIDDLADPSFRVREDAQSELIEWARGSPDARALILLKIAREAPDPEVRQRSHNVLREIAMDEYLSNGEGYMGIQMVPVIAALPGEGNDPKEVISITRVLPDTPARHAGLRVGDLITSVNQAKFNEDDPLSAFQQMIRELQPGKPATFTIIRGEEVMEIVVVLGRRPPIPETRFFGQQMADLNELARRDQEAFFRDWLKKLEN